MKKWKLFAIAAVLVAAVVVGGTAAYLNDTERHTDAVTLAGNLEIELLQPAWKGGATAGVQPHQVIEKDPRILNKSDFDVFAYLEVVMPYADDLVLQDAAGRPVNAGAPGGPLYRYDVLDGWTLLADPSFVMDGGERRVSYVYAWMKDGAMVPLKAGEATGPLFTRVEVVNYAKATLGSRQDLTVNAYALDAAVLRDTDPTAPRTPQAMWTLLKNTYPSPSPTAQP